MEHAVAGTGIRVTRERLLPLGVTGGFFGIGLTALFLLPFLLWQAREPLIQANYTHYQVVFIVHMAALGWATAIALGAWQQLSVVALQAEGTPRFKAAWTSVLLYALGLPSMLFGLYQTNYWVVAAGGALVVGAFFAVIATSFHARALAERRTIMSPFVVGALLSLIGVGIVGLLLAMNRLYGFLGTGHLTAFKSHLYLGPVGWFGLLIPGVSYELAPFFGITRVGRDAGRGRHAMTVFLLLALGVGGGLIASLIGTYHPAFLLPLSVGYLVFIYDLRGIYRRRGLTRRTPTLIGVRWSHLWLVMAAALLLGASIIGSYFWGFRMNVAVGWVVGLGWVTNAVVGYLHRILPFLFWHHRYWGKKREEVKTRFPHMVDEALGRRGINLYNIGVVMGFIGLWYEPLFPFALIPLGIGLWMCIFNLGYAYFK